MGRILVAVIILFGGTAELHSRPIEDRPTLQNVVSPAWSSQRPFESHLRTREMVDWEEYLEDRALRAGVDFWIQIYSKYSVDEGVIHDQKYPQVIYEVLDLKDLKPRALAKKVRKSKRHWRAVLRSIHQKKGVKLTKEEKRVFDLFEDVKGKNRFIRATYRARIRYQKGQKENFLKALQRSGKYLSMMESVFREEGVPIELTRIPFVESSFNLRARSKVGASGVWQFIRSTGQAYMIVNSVVDERNDPIQATRAAARLLRKNYESLRAWPLAVVAYNHGRRGMMRAVRKVGSLDVRDVVRKYRSRSFRFASRNFFMEFLAAVIVERNSELYFGSIERDPALEFEEIELSDYVSTSVLLEHLGISADVFAEYNPALTRRVLKGKSRIPKGFRIRIPKTYQKNGLGARESFWKVYKEIPSKFKHRSQR